MQRRQLAAGALLAAAALAGCEQSSAPPATAELPPAAEPGVYALTPTVRLVRRISLGGTPYGIAIDTPHRRVWVTLTSANRLLGFQLSDGPPRPIASFATVRQPNTVAVDPTAGRLYVASRTTDRLQTITAPP